MKTLSFLPTCRTSLPLIVAFDFSIKSKEPEYKDLVRFIRKETLESIRDLQ